MKLFIIPSWYPTEIHPGSGTFFRDRAQILHRSGIEVVVAAPVIHSLRDLIRFFPNKSIQPKIDEGLRTYLLERINIFPKMEKLFFARYKKIALTVFNRSLETHGIPDLILIHSSLWAGAALGEIFYNLGIPFVITEHLKEFLLPNGFSEFQKIQIQGTYSKAHKILTSSNALKNSISESFIESHLKLELLPNPVNEDQFTLRKIPLSDSQFTIICIALFRPEKRIDLVLDAFYLLHQSGLKAKLKLIGDGPLYQDIERQIQKLGISSFVALRGYLPQSQIIAEFHNSHLLVLGSIVETFGMVLVEAQACGLPVIATDCGGPRDIITPETGILVQPGSAEELSKGMLKIINSYKKYNPSTIRNLTIQKFGKQVYMDSIKNIISN